MENKESNNTTSHTSESVKTGKQAQTYFVVGSEETGLIEIDLVTFREKNQQMRYLGMSFNGINVKTNEPQKAFVTIDNEDAFNELKTFFAQLEWNS